MANQAIALGVRVPQTDILGGAIQRNAQLMNMMAQQRVAERQAAMAQQEMQLKQAKETREASAADIDLAGKKIDYYTKLAGQTLTPEGYTVLLGKLDKDAPDIASAFRANLPPERFNRNELLKMVGSIGDNFKATYGPLETEVVQDENGNYGVAVTGGFALETGQQGVIPLTELKRKPTPTAPNPAAAPSGATPPPYQAPSAPATDEAIDAAAKAIAGGANMTDPAIRDLTPNDLKRAQDKAMKGVLAQPIAFNPAEGMGVADLTVETAPQIIQAAMQNGMIDQKHVEQLRQIVGPENDQALANWMRQNNVRIQPTGEASFRSAVYRPETDAAGMQRTQYLDGYESTGRQFKGKSPMQSPLPGSSQVPLPRVAAEAKAQRKTSQEIYDETVMQERAKNDVDFLKNLPKAKQSAQLMIGLVDQMVGDAQVNPQGQITIKKGGRAPKAGFEDVVGATWRPGYRFISGTDAANFDALLKQVEGQQFLQAYETLKGTGQITEIEGQKATDAMSRMKRSVSETEFVKAAREFMGVMRTVEDRLNQREREIGGVSGTPRRTPTKGPKAAPNTGWGSVTVVGE